MTPDEMAKKMEFILDMQTHFTSNLARSEANTDNLRASVARTEVNIDKLKINLDSLRVTVADLAGVVRESIKISDDRFTRFDERLAKLADAQKTTDDRLNTLISVVERHITGPDHLARP